MYVLGGIRQVLYLMVSVNKLESGRFFVRLFVPKTEPQLRGNGKMFQILWKRIRFLCRLYAALFV